MPEPLLRALETMAEHVLDPDRLIKAVLSGRQRGQEPPAYRRVELRWVDLKGAPHLQVVAYDRTQAHTSNHAAGDAAGVAVDDLLGAGYGNWHVETTTETHQVRVTKRLEAQVHTTRRATPAVAPDRSHDRDKERLLAEDDPVLVELGISDAQGRLKPSRTAKLRQVEEFLRLLDACVVDAIAKGHLRRPTVEDPLRLVDLGCGNAYLTFAAQRYLAVVRGLPVAADRGGRQGAVARAQQRRRGAARRRARRSDHVRRRLHRRRRARPCGG